MDLRPLGSSGTLVSAFCLGTMTFGAESDEAESHRILDRYFEAGGNFVDTADVYTRGAAEEIVGRWLARRGGSDDVVLATKGRFPMGDGPNDQGNSRRHLRRALEASLRRLGVDHVDLYQLHCWDPATPLDETLDALTSFVRAGLVEHVGISNFSGWQLQRAALLSPVPIVTLQPSYNLLAREIEWELIPCCLANRIGVLPWGPLGGGWLTGKYRREDGPSGATRLGENPARGIEAWERRDVDRTWEIIGVVQSIAEARACTLAQVALRWVDQRPAVSSTILGARTVEQLDDNLGAVGWRLSDDEMARLDEASEPPTPDYPYGFLGDMTSPRREQAGLPPTAPGRF